jgi:vacuolar-type H+-ATPase subunit F/Vma7
MRPAVFLGDEVTGAGYRLAGLVTRVPTAGAEAAALETACAEAELVLVTAEVAARVPAVRLARLFAALRPLLLVVGDAAGRVPVPDISARLRRQVGVAE